PCRNAMSGGAASPAEPACRKPMIGIGCCARTASGRAPAPASKPIKWRRVKSCNRIPCPPETTAQEAMLKKLRRSQERSPEAIGAASLNGPALLVAQKHSSHGIDRERVDVSHDRHGC